MNKKRGLSGLLFLLAGIIAFMGIITAEIFYPENLSYTTKLREISDLGATRPPEGLVTQPSATIFDTSMLSTGVLLVVGAHFLRQSKFSRATTIIVSVLGTAIFLVGVFPGDRAPMHGIAAMVTFISGGIAALISSRAVSSNLKYIFLIFGITTLIFFFFAGKFVPIFGMGGTERYVAYPVILWIIAFGGYLIGKNE